MAFISVMMSKGETTSKTLGTDSVQVIMPLLRVKGIWMSSSKISTEFAKLEKSNHVMKLNSKIQAEILHCLHQSCFLHHELKKQCSLNSKPKIGTKQFTGHGT